MELAKFPVVKSVRCLHDYQLERIFADSVKGSIDFASWIVGQRGVFAPLEDKQFFALSPSRFIVSDSRAQEGGQVPLPYNGT